MRTITRRIGAWVNDPWRPPVVLAMVTWVYILWSIVPVLIAIQFSFNSGRSRSTWQGFSMRWWWGDDQRSLLHDPALRQAMINSLTLAAFTMLIATPLGVGLALGLARWRGRTARASNLLMLVPLSTPEIVMGAMLFLVFDNLYTGIPLGRPAMLLGHITFSVSYVVVIVRGRLLSIGRDVEEAAQDLGATPIQALRTVLLPLLGPAIFASLMIVFATSIDDFVISAFLSSDASSETVPIKIYSNVRGSPTPALNALATAMLIGTTVAIGLAMVSLKLFRRGERGSAVEDFARLDI
jgi:spermidine/putrescine transport system permease protein